MAKESDQYREKDPETNQYFWTCPNCESKPRFDSLGGFKYHMQKEHGGYLASDIEAASPSVSDSREAVAARPGTPAATAPVQKTKKLSAKARELNDKFNRCITLCIKHLMKGLTETEITELEQLRGDVSEAVIGVEFDFEDKLVAVSGKWALVIALGLLYILPQIPTLKDVIAKAREQAAKKKLEASK